MKKRGIAEFISEYDPIALPNNQADIVFEPNTYGYELAPLIKPDHVWSMLLREGGGCVIHAGYDPNPKNHYFITNRPWVSPDETFDFD